MCSLRSVWLYTYFANMDEIQRSQMGQDEGKKLCWEIEQVGHDG